MDNTSSNKHKIFCLRHFLYNLQIALAHYTEGNHNKNLEIRKKLGRTAK
jgi:hypothetical protein